MSIYDHLSAKLKLKPLFFLSMLISAVFLSPLDCHKLYQKLKMGYLLCTKGLCGQVCGQVTVSQESYLGLQLSNCGAFCTTLFEWWQ